MVLESSSVVWSSRSSKILAICYWHFQSSAARLFCIGGHEWRSKIPDSSGRSLNRSITFCPHMVNYFHLVFVVFDSNSFALLQLQSVGFACLWNLRQTQNLSPQSHSWMFRRLWIRLREGDLMYKGSDEREWNLRLSFFSSKNLTYIPVHTLRIYFPVETWIYPFTLSVPIIFVRLTGFFLSWRNLDNLCCLH